MKHVIGMGVGYGPNGLSQFVMLGFGPDTGSVPTEPPSTLLTGESVIGRAYNIQNTNADSTKPIDPDEGETVTGAAHNAPITSPEPDAGDLS